MDEIVHLGEASQCPSSQVPRDVQNDFPADFPDSQRPVQFDATGTGAPTRGRGRPNSGRPSPVSSQSQVPTSHKVRGPNWTEAEMLVLIGQKRVEWDGRHNCNQPSLAKFVYGTTAWKAVLAGCMAVVGFRARDVDQITNKWDGLIKDYKKLKDYIEGTGSANWWGMTREERKELSKTRKMSLEFSETMYTEMEGFVGRRQIFGRSTDAVDSDRPAPLVARPCRRSTPAPRDSSLGGAGSPLGSTTTASESPTSTSPGNDTPGSTGCKRKAVGIDNLVYFVKDFNHEYLPRVEAQNVDKRAWRADMLAFDTAREARLTQKGTQAAAMEQKFYELEAECTKNLGNMTGVLLMLASSMDALTRFGGSLNSCLPSLQLLFNVFLHDWLCGGSFGLELNSPRGPPWPFNPQATPAPHSQDPLVLEAKILLLLVWVSRQCCPWAGDRNQ